MRYFLQAKVGQKMWRLKKKLKLISNLKNQMKLKTTWKEMVSEWTVQTTAWQEVKTEKLEQLQRPRLRN